MKSSKFDFMARLFAFMQAADPAVAAIEKVGGAVRKIAQNDERQEVDFHLQGATVKDEHVKPVAQLKKVMRVHLGKTSITDAALASLRPLAADLVELHLEGTKVTDAGLAQLKPLVNLTYLNLYGTEVSDAGLANLTGLKNLKNLYVWQTKVTEEGAKKLKAALPSVNVDRGWELPPPPPPKEEPKKEEKKQ
jgi:hypothetical protein